MIEKYANRKRLRGLNHQEGDKVYLLRKNIKTKRPSNKLDFVKLRPYKINRKLGLVNYKLQLLTKSKVYLVFHTALLEKAPD